MERKELSIVIADDEPITRMDLREILTEEGYTVLGEASDGFDVLELCRKHLPDLVLMDIKMPLLDGLAAAKIIEKEKLAGTVILLTAYNEREFVETAKQCGIAGYLVKPIDEKSLIPTIEMAVVRSREMEKLKKDMEKVTERLESRKLVEQAKGLVMTTLNMTEQDAYEYIRRLSLTKGISMRRVAEIILIKNGK